MAININYSTNIPELKTKIEQVEKLLDEINNFDIKITVSEPDELSDRTEVYHLKNIDTPNGVPYG